MPQPLTPRPIDATLSVTKAARLLGVHPNTVRAWSDAGRLRYYRINPRGDRRYRLGDLQRFLAAAEHAGALTTSPPRSAGVAVRHDAGSALVPLGRRHGRPERVAARTRKTDAGVGWPATFGRLAELVDEAAEQGGPELDRLLTAAARAIRDGGGFATVDVWEQHGDRLRRRVGGDTAFRFEADRRASPLFASAIVADGSVGASHGVDGPEAAAAIRLRDGSVWGVLSAVTRDTASRDGEDRRGDRDPLAAAARAIGAILGAARRAEVRAHQVHRAEALRRVAADIGSRLDLDQILARVVDHAMVLFGADRGAIFLRKTDGRAVAEVTRNLSAAYLEAVRTFPTPSLPDAAIAARRPLAARSYARDARGTGVRAAVVQEGYDTICTAPLLDGDDVLGLLNVYHDAPYDWTTEELDTMGAFAEQAATAIKNAQTFVQMAARSAQLQSIQQLGTRLTRLSTVREIGLAIAGELHQLIDYHNVRVYRLEGEDLIPVAMRGQVGEYIDETPEQLRSRLGQGITGWVAEHKLAQIVGDAANDPRAQTIPGTEDDLPESMLLAPMIFEDRVLGVLVLSKLGLDQFSDDDLRLLVIYASLAAQAMANADATEQLRAQSGELERQLRSQRDLLQITESILTTLDPRAVLDQIADRLGALVQYDNISIEVFDRATRTLRPLTSRGVSAEEQPRDEDAGRSITHWVIEHNEPVLVVDRFDDPRVGPGASPSRPHGGLVVVPLRNRDGASGVLSLERLGEGNTFEAAEFELVKLFAAQVSIALQNAEAHSAVEIRARTDDLTGLLNHGTFVERLATMVARSEPFSLVMLDLDDFKLVNDALGHQAGDRFLAEIGRALIAAGRDTDQVFRYGGDEFTVLLAGAGAEAARAIADRLRAAILGVGGPGSRWHSGGVSVGASIGLATFPTDGTTADSVLLAADRACFVAKRGRTGIATAEEGLALAAEFSLQEPTPVDPPSRPGPAEPAAPPPPVEAA